MTTTIGRATSRPAMAASRNHSMVRAMRLLVVVLAVACSQPAPSPAPPPPPPGPASRRSRSSAPTICTARSSGCRCSPATLPTSAPRARPMAAACCWSTPATCSRARSSRTSPKAPTSCARTTSSATPRSAVGNHEFDYGPEGPAATAKRRRRSARRAQGARRARRSSRSSRRTSLDATTGARIKWPNMPASTLIEVAGHQGRHRRREHRVDAVHHDAGELRGPRESHRRRRRSPSEARLLRARARRSSSSIAHIGSACKRPRSSRRYLVVRSRRGAVPA